MLTFVMLLHLIFAALIGIAGTILYMKDKAVISSGPSATMGLYWKTFIFFFLPAYFILFAIGSLFLELVSALGMILAAASAIGAIYIMFVQKEELTDLIEKKYIGIGLLVVSLVLFFTTRAAQEFLGETNDNNKPSYTHASSVNNQSYQRPQQQEARLPATSNANSNSGNNNLSTYVSLKNQYDREISNLANDINTYLGNHANFKNEKTMLQRAEKISRQIYGAKEALRNANIQNTALKNKLIEVFDALQGRVDGLLDGIRASKNGRDYHPGFDRGGDAYDRFEEANKALNRML